MSTFARMLSEITATFRASRKLPWVEVPPVSPQNVIYHRASPLWAKWAHIIVGLDVMMVTSIVEYTWNISGMSKQAKQLEDAEVETKGSAPDTLPEHLADRMQLQPVWKKSIFSGMFVLSGVFFAVGLLSARARLLRTLTYVNATGAGRRGTLYFQTASHPKKFGVAIPVKECSILATDSPSRLVIKVNGLGKWHVDLTKTSVQGLPREKYDVARVAMLRAWNAAGGHVLPAQK